MNNKLSIGIIGTRGIPNQYGGYEAAVQELAPLLVAKGHDVVVYCSSLQSTKENQWNGVKLIYSYDPEDKIGSFGQFIYDLRSNIKARKQKHDVIFHMGYTSDSIWHWLWDPNARHITNMDGMEWMRSKYSGRVRKFLKKAEKWAALKSDMLIADSVGIEDYLKRNYNTPVMNIAYGVSVPDVFDDNHLKDYNLLPYKYDIIIARTVPENNIELAIDSKIKSKNEYPLIIFGNKNDYWVELSNRYQANPRIKFMDSNYDRNIMDSIRHFSRYYIHGHSVGGTNPSLLEAMAAQSRIIAHDNVFNRGVLQNGGLFFKSSVDIVTIFDATDIITKEQINNNLTRLLKEYNWDKICDQYEEAACCI